jgi:GH18 family chitinase
VNRGWSSFDKYPRQLADVNGDGRADIVGFGPGNVFVALGQKDGTFESKTIATSDFSYSRGWNSFDQNPRQLADVNGDGSADIVAFGDQNVFVALAESGNDGGTSDYILGGYIGSWNLDSSTLVDATFNKLTHLFYSFADVRPDGTVTLPNDWYSWDRSTNDGTKLQEIKAQNPNLKIMLSIGGALEGDFSSAVGDNSTSTTRTNFVNSAINLMNQHGFDGIDIDWETPKHTENPEYIDLLDKLDQALPAGKLLTTATMASQWYLEGTGDYKLAADLNWNGTTKSVLAHTSDIVDFINVMSYDYKATWAADTTTGHQAALGTTNEVNTVAWAVDYYLNKGVDSKDIVMGLPLYGRNWTGVNAGANNGLNMTGTPTLNDGTPYSELHTRLNNNEYEYFWDDSAKVPYLYNSQTKEFFTYEDTRSIGAKTDYVKDLGLGGAFFWEIPGDLPITHSDSLINAAATNLASII